MSGFIAMQREARDHPLFKGHPDRFYAWFWMVCEACWKPTKFDVGGRIVTLNRGQFSTSIRRLADEVGMSKGAVERFLTRLKTETMIETDSGTGRLIVTICNYEKYQEKPKKAGTPSGTPKGTPAGQQRDTKEQGNKETKEPNGSKARKRAQRPDDVSEDVWRDFNDQRKKLFTETALKIFVGQVEEAGWSLDEAFAYATMRGWEGFNAEWVEKREAPRQAAQEPGDWLAYCEGRAKRARELGRANDAEEWDFKAAEARRKAIPALRIINGEA